MKRAANHESRTFQFGHPLHASAWTSSCDGHLNPTCHKWHERAHLQLLSSSTNQLTDYRFHRHKLCSTQHLRDAWLVRYPQTIGQTSLYHPWWPIRDFHLWKLLAHYSRTGEQMPVLLDNQPWQCAPFASFASSQCGQCPWRVAFEYQKCAYLIAYVQRKNKMRTQKLGTTTAPASKPIPSWCHGFDHGKPWQSLPAYSQSTRRLAQYLSNVLSLLIPTFLPTHNRTSIVAVPWMKKPVQSRTGYIFI